MDMMTVEKLNELVISHHGQDSADKGRRIKIDGRGATVIYTYCCVAGMKSGYAHLDGDPSSKLSRVTFSEDEWDEFIPCA